MKTVLRYSKQAKRKVEVPCPSVIKQYNGKMGGIDKSDMLTHLYKTPTKAKRWHMNLFGYLVDLCICNAWICYKRDCQALGSNAMPLKVFRLDISKFALCYKAVSSRVTRLSVNTEAFAAPRRGHRALLPSLEERLDNTRMHLPTYVPNRQTCKHCSKKGDAHRSRWVCEVCKVALCLSDTRNCFKAFHSG